jgi:hypothetical protein
MVYKSINKMIVDVGGRKNEGSCRQMRKRRRDRRKEVCSFLIGIGPRCAFFVGLSADPQCDSFFLSLFLS